MENVSSPTERKIIRRLLDDAAVLGLLVSVYDGEEWALKLSADRNAIEAVIGATDETTLAFRDPARLGADGKPERLGVVMLVHGNHEDVIADCSDNPATTGLLAGAMSVANEGLN